MANHGYCLGAEITPEAFEDFGVSPATKPFGAVILPSPILHLRDFARLATQVAFWRLNIQAQPQIV